MHTSLMASIVNNAAILIALSMVYEVAHLVPESRRKLRPVLTGSLIGLLGIVLMLFPFELAPGLYFDTRSILLSVAALSFGGPAIAIAAAMTAFYRFFSGGVGAIPGVMVILASAGIGLAWRHVFGKGKGWRQWGETYLMGLAVHAVMLACMLLLPYPQNLNVIREIWLPIMMVHPVVTVLLAELIRLQTSRNEALLRIAETESRYRSMFENSHLVKMILDRETGRIIDINQAAERFYGWNHATLLKMHISDINTQPDSQVREALGQATDGRVNRFIFKHRRANREPCDVEVHVSPIQYDGRMVLYSVVHDISERVAMERERDHMVSELERARVQAVAANEAKSQFLANMSHEIRTPLNGLMGMIQLLDRTPLSESQKELLQIAQTSANTLLSVINDILDYSRIEAGKVDFEVIPFSIRKTVEEACNLFLTASMSKGIPIRIEITDEILDICLGDPFRLRQILSNLIGNAVKYTNTGSIDVAVETEGTQDDGKQHLVFSVRDTGIGIAPDKLGILFKRFSQVDGSNTRIFGGSGLGLSICKGLVEKMGGEIWAQSVKDSGSCFTFTCAFLMPDRPSAARAGEEKSGSAEENGSGGETPRLLLVEDDEISRVVVSEFARLSGRQVVTAKDGKEALALYGRMQFAAILMDIQMPVMDGFQATREIRRLEAATGGRTPIIAMTAHSLKGDQEKCLVAGMDDFLGKPLLESDFLSVIQKWT